MCFPVFGPAFIPDSMFLALQPTSACPLPAFLVLADWTLPWTFWPSKQLIAFIWVMSLSQHLCMQNHYRGANYILSLLELPGILLMEWILYSCYHHASLVKRPHTFCVDCGKYLIVMSKQMLLQLVYNILKTKTTCWYDCSYSLTNKRGQESNNHNAVWDDLGLSVVVMEVMSIPLVHSCGIKTLMDPWQEFPLARSLFFLCPCPPFRGEGKFTHTKSGFCISIFQHAQCSSALWHYNIKSFLLILLCILLAGC